MPSYKTGRVTAILGEREGLQRVEVDGKPAYVLTQLIGTVAMGDRVVINTTATELGLGTGGWDVVHWNLEREEWSEPGPGHEMKLRYTTTQVDTGLSSASTPREGGGQPVVVCFLHSQLAAVAAAFKHINPTGRLAYVMTDGGALPLAISDLVADLCSAAWIDVTATAGQAFGGDREAANVAHALALCGDADLVVVGMGPGSLGSDSDLGFSALEAGWIVDAANAMDANPIVAVRWSDADSRERHRGMSHHVRTALRMARSTATIAVPRGSAPLDLGDHEVIEVDVPDIGPLFDKAGIDVRTMGRTPAEDPGFFAYAGAAGVLAAHRAR